MSDLGVLKCKSTFELFNLANIIIAISLLSLSLLVVGIWVSCSSGFAGELQSSKSERIDALAYLLKGTGGLWGFLLIRIFAEVIIVVASQFASKHIAEKEVAAYAI